MNCRLQRRLAAVGVFLPLLAPSQVEAQEEKEWAWKDIMGETRTRAELEEVLAEHKLWLASKQSRGTRANLTGAILIGADLGKADLSRAVLIHVDLGRRAWAKRTCATRS